MRNRELHLKHMEVFRAVIVGGSASEAARMLGLSQPAVSKIIAQAEILMGVALFERRQGRLVPTTKALRLYDETDVLFSTLDNLDRIVERVAKDEAVPLAFGAVPLLATTLLPQVLPRWLAMSGHTVALHTHGGAILRNMVAARQVELALMVAMPPVQGVESHVIARSPVYCAVPRDHRLASQDTIRAEDLEEQPYISLSRSEGIQNDIDRILLAGNIRPHEIMQVPLMASAVAMANAGAGITLVDAFAMQIGPFSGLVFKPFEPSIHFEYKAIWPARKEPDFDRNGLVQAIRRAARVIVDGARARD